MVGPRSWEEWEVATLNPKRRGPFCPFFTVVSTIPDHLYAIPDHFYNAAWGLGIGLYVDLMLKNFRLEGTYTIGLSCISDYWLIT